MNTSASMTLATPADAFDRVAESYDEMFTNSVIGQTQRRQVWRWLLTAFAVGERVLEMNCGTGEDARFLGLQGRIVVACDASAGMIEVAAARTQGLVERSLVAFHQLANEDLDDLPRQALFDGAFSNFSGLNCVSDLRTIAEHLAPHVKPGGRVLICLWNRICPAEIVWYLLHGQARKAFRRFSGNSTARIGDRTISVFYPTVRHVQQAFSPSFAFERLTAIGLFVPPSYFERWATNHRRALKGLDRLDAVFAAWPMFSRLGDHVLLEFKKCTR
jgi:SAM-dependent methyltransferase